MTKVHKLTCDHDLYRGLLDFLREIQETFENPDQWPLESRDQAEFMKMVYNNAKQFRKYDRFGAVMEKMIQGPGR